MRVDLGTFLLRLQGSGQVRVDRDPPPPGDAAAVLREFDAAVRSDAPSCWPQLDLPVAMWAAERLYAGCALFVHRDLGTDAIDSRLRVPCPSPAGAATTHASADLALCHLGELLRLARGVAPGDPLLVALREIGAAFPLSSVGIPQLGELDAVAIRTIADDPGLRGCYVDRILRHDDAGRVGEPRIARAIAAAVGEQRQLAATLQAVRIALTSCPDPDRNA